MKIIEQNFKPFWKSKAVWAGLVLATIPWVEGLKDYATNPTAISLIGLAIMGLRFFVKDRVTMDGEPTE